MNNHRDADPARGLVETIGLQEKPERTELVVEWINLGLDDPAALDERFAFQATAVYRGAA